VKSRTLKKQSVRHPKFRTFQSLAHPARIPHRDKTRTLHKKREECATRKFKPASKAVPPAMRPVPGWSQHRMPIPGLYQTGGTTHPGGGVSGGPGRNAAVVMLKDFGTSMEEALSKKG
jgi:hypothetical protein